MYLWTRFRHRFFSGSYTCCLSLQGFRLNWVVNIFSNEFVVRQTVEVVFCGMILCWQNMIEVFILFNVDVWPVFIKMIILTTQPFLKKVRVKWSSRHKKIKYFIFTNNPSEASSNYDVTVTGSNMVLNSMVQKYFRNAFVGRYRPQTNIFEINRNGSR